MIHAAAYCRVSTAGQTGEDKFGIPAQEQAIKEYCAANGIEVVCWYIDEGVSGAKEDRPELRKLINGGATNPPIEAVVVAKTDRLSRKIEQYYWYKYTLEKKGIKLLSVNEDFGAAGTFAPVYEALVAVFAQMEREMISARMSGGRDVKASRGGYSGGNTPYGYTCQRGEKRLSVQPEEAETVRRIFRLRESGASLRAICDALTNDGITARNGKPFYPSGVDYIVKNRKTYEGYYKYGKGEWVKGAHEPILKEGAK